MIIDVEGYFWLPAEPELEVPGRLTFDGKRGATLSLLGSLKLRGNGNRVVGRGGDGYYTLDDCFVTNDKNAGAIITQKIHAGRILGGVAYDADEEPVFDRVDFGINYLAEWVQPPHIDETIDFRTAADGSREPLTLTLHHWPSRTVTLPGAELTLSQFQGVSGDGLRERQLTQSMSFSWQLSSDRTLPDTVDLASDIQDLVSIGTDRVAAFDYVHLYHKDITRGRFPHAVRLMTPWLAQPDPEHQPLHPSAMAFTFTDIDGMAGIESWLGVAERYRSMLGHIMNTRYSRMFSDVKLVFRVAALHGLHRTWKGHERTLNVALMQLAELAGDPFAELVPDVEAWCRIATAERNNLAHHYQRPIHQNSADLYGTSEAAYWLFVLCMMRCANFPQTAFEHVQRCPQFRWLKQQFV